MLKVEKLYLYLVKGEEHDQWKNLKKNKIKYYTSYSACLLI